MDQELTAAAACVCHTSWNCLHDTVRNCQSSTGFLSRLKTYYFNTAFYDLLYAVHYL